MSRKFFPYRNTLYAIDHIDRIELHPSHITVVMRNGDQLPLDGFWMLHLLGRVAPEVLEGNTIFRWARNTWAIHNLIGHPLMQLLSWAGYTRLGIRIHDLTVPAPVGLREDLGSKPEDS